MPQLFKIKTGPIAEIGHTDQKLSMRFEFAFVYHNMDY